MGQSEFNIADWQLPIADCPLTNPARSCAQAQIGNPQLAVGNLSCLS
jgi:hypothetical protein